MNDDKDFRRIRAEVARLRVDAIPAEAFAVEAEAGVRWVPVPGRPGYLPVTGAPDGPPSTWYLEGRDITYADLLAVQERLVAEGLGSLATVSWRRRRYEATALLWGASTAAVVRTLAVSFRTIWLDLTAAVEAAAEVAWAPGQRRVSDTGVIVTALGDRMLWLRRADDDVDVDAMVSVDSPAWLDGVRQAMSDLSLDLLRDFDAQHASDGRPAQYFWPARGDVDRGQVVIAPAEALHAARATASAQTRR